MMWMIIVCYDDGISYPSDTTDDILYTDDDVSYTDDDDSHNSTSASTLLVHKWHLPLLVHKWHLTALAYFTRVRTYSHFLTLAHT